MREKEEKMKLKDLSSSLILFQFDVLARIADRVTQYIYSITVLMPSYAS